MCGLVAVINKRTYGFSNDQRDAFTTMLFIDTLRGEDSTGVFVVNNYGNVDLIKEATFAPDFIRDKAYTDIMQKAYRQGWCAVGHNRKATKGTINDQNAHPFVADDNIVLVHNGTYYGDHKKLADTEVDSEAITQLLASSDDIEEAMTHVNAAYALIWYNVAEKSLHVIRNDARPLYLMETADSYMLASEWPFLHLAAGRHNLKTTEETRLLAKHELLTFKLKDDKYTTVTSTQLNCHYKPPPMPPQPPKNPDTENFPTAAPKTGGNVAAGVNTPTNVVPMIPKTKTLMDRFLSTLTQDTDTVSYMEFAMLNKELPTGSIIRLCVNNIVEANDSENPTEFFLIGKCITHPKLFGAFHIHESDFQKLVGMTDNGV